MKKVEIETDCGEVSTIYISQDIKKITVDGDKFAPFGYKLNNETDVEQVLGLLLGGTWKWRTNQDETTFKGSLAWYHGATSNFSIPEDPMNIVYVPHHWIHDGTKSNDDVVGVYCRENVKLVNPKHVFLSTP